MMRLLTEMTWSDADRVAADSILLVPVGSTEQHGPHLPLGSDTIITLALCEALAQARPDVVVLAPPIHFSSSGEHSGFAGTISIGQGALEIMLVELARSADAFAGVAFVSAHGGNAEVLARVQKSLRSEGRCALAWWPSPPKIHHQELGHSPNSPQSPPFAESDLHAGRAETSMVLALAPQLVREEDFAKGYTERSADLLARLKVGGVASVSANGVLGDPFGANSHEGTALLATMTKSLSTQFDSFLLQVGLASKSTKDGTP